MNNTTSDLEMLRLVTAFFNIGDPQTRRIILAIAEEAADGTPITTELLRALMDEAKLR